MTIRYNRLLIRYGGYFVGATVGILYLMNLFSANPPLFVTTAGSLVVTSGLLAGLCFGFSSVIETPTDKKTAANAGEKFFFATVCWMLSGLAGFAALNIDAFAPVWLLPWMKTIASGTMKLFAVSFLACAGGAMIHGHDWITELFMVRWNRRLIRVDEEDKQPSIDSAA